LFSRRLLQSVRAVRVMGGWVMRPSAAGDRAAQ